MYQALLFDLDGTLAETDSLHLPISSSPTRPLTEPPSESSASPPAKRVHFWWRITSQTPN
jgi:beta-phosphoglucomutase-like phosphatase (HAD superfamily)